MAGTWKAGLPDIYTTRLHEIYYKAKKNKAFFSIIIEELNATEIVNNI